MQDRRRGSEKLQQACCDIWNLSLEDVQATAGGIGLKANLYSYFPKGIPSPGSLGGIEISVIEEDTEVLRLN